MDFMAKRTTSTGWCSCHTGCLCLSLGGREGVRGDEKEEAVVEQWALEPLGHGCVAAVGQES